jgi:major vault protein
LIKEQGAYIPHIKETILEVVVPFIFSPGRALELRALQDYTDVYGIKRKAGEEWVLTD